MTKTQPKAKAVVKGKTLSAKKREFMEAVVVRTLNPKKKEVDKRSPEHKSIQKALDEGDWGCQKRHVYALISAVVGGTFTPSLKEYPAQGCCIVLRRNPNGHNYPLHRTIFVLINDDHGVDEDGRTGNHLPLHHRDSYRLATETEIRKFFEGLPKHGWERVGV